MCWALFGVQIKCGHLFGVQIKSGHLFGAQIWASVWGSNQTWAFFWGSNQIWALRRGSNLGISSGLKSGTAREGADNVTSIPDNILRSMFVIQLLSDSNSSYRNIDVVHVTVTDKHQTWRDLHNLDLTCPGWPCSYTAGVRASPTSPGSQLPRLALLPTVKGCACICRRAFTFLPVEKESVQQQ